MESPSVMKSTMAEFDRSAHFQSQHISEAIQYGTLDRQLWV